MVYVPSDQPRGTVVAQAQPSGTELEQGDTVQVNVSEGADPPADASVPDVVGLERDDARERIGDAGFEVLAIELGEGEGGRGRLPVARRRRRASRVAHSSCVYLGG